MSVELLGGATIVDFVEDEEAFSATIRERFSHLDTDRDGVLSYAEMLKELQSLRVLETHFGVDVKLNPDELSSVYGSLFLQFNWDCNGKVDIGEFMAETKKMMLAMANGIGFFACSNGAGREQLVEESCGERSHQINGCLIKCL